MEEFIFTAENLLNNLDKLGGWSSYGLAIEALQHYFPNKYDEFGDCDIDTELELMKKLECNNWQDIIIKYHKEVGYKSFDPKAVNQY
jgi:hypothetical protein